MKLIRNATPVPLFASSVVTIGNFDGIHLGHAALLTRLKAIAEERHCPAVVMLFEPQPLEFFRQEEAPARLTSLREKFQFIRSFGIDALYLIRFNQPFSQLTADQFIQQYLIEQLQAHAILMGEDFCFGRDRSGNAAYLQAQSAALNLSVETFPEWIQNGIRISSTQVRQALADDDFATAETLLGRPYSISGKVIYGNQLARTLDCPTANINMDRKKPALQGVYSVRVRHLRTGHVYDGVANIGTRPTINGQRAVLEAHLFDFDGSLYGDHLEVIFEQKIREEKKFESLDDLKAAIAQDICKAKAIKAKLIHSPDSAV